MSRRFKRWEYSSLLSPSAVVSLDDPCGIYVLEFADGQQYVGKTKNFYSRLADHRRHWSDIVAVSFAPVLEDEQDRAEYDEIQRRRRSGIRLRNKTMLVEPLGNLPFDVVIDQQNQADWLLEEIDEDTMNAQYLKRAEEAACRLRCGSRRAEDSHWRRLQQLKQHPGWSELLDASALYVFEAIPFAHQTEGRVWTASALPATGRRRDFKRLATLSINNVEAVFFCEERLEGEFECFTRLNLAADVAITDENAAFVEVGDFYRSAGRTAFVDVWGLSLDGPLQIPEILVAARNFARGQMRKGTTMFSRFHNVYFADEIFLRIRDFIGTDASS